MRKATLLLLIIFFMMADISVQNEAKESRYWLELSIPRTEEKEIKTHLIDESTQLIKIFATIIKNASQ